MTLHALIASLLPAAYREQVLGDLQERGFHAGDVVSAVAAAWVSYLRRQWRGPDLANLTEAVLRTRAEQFRRRQLVFLLGYLFIFGATRHPFGYAPTNDVLALFAIALLGLGYAALRKALPTGREPLLEHYRAQLRQSRQMIPINGFMMGHSTLHLFLASVSRTQRVVVNGVLLFAFLLAMWARDRRVRRQLEVLR